MPTVKNTDGTVVPASVTDYWVYANDEAIGVWQADRRIPVLADGVTNIKVIAGVRKNGVTNDRIQYPFYATSSQDVELTLGQETSVDPVFTWYDAPIWTEGFEIGTSFDTAGSEVGFHRFEGSADTADILVGSAAAGIFLDTEHDYFQAVSIASPSFPTGTEPTFLEIDYRSDTRFLVGVKYESGGGTVTLPYLFVNATGPVGGSLPWGHIYIDLATPWGGGGTTNRRFYIQAQLENGATSGRITLDNMNVFH